MILSSFLFLSRCVGENKPILYREEVPLTQWVTIMIGILITIITPTLLLELLAAHKEPRLLYLYAILDSFFVAIMLNFRKLVIEINSEHLTTSFGLIRKRVSLDEIIDCEQIEAKLSVFTGMGIRYGGDGSLAYLTDFGAAVKIYLEDKRPFVFSTKNPEVVLETLDRYCQKERRSPPIL